ncbi:alpha/beta fold hydrolase [Streptomyces smyrnaeus]|uniref:alpha/beta fold hydrolase n=1 Tax=Streptomyces TaxID=1883 RepID=UPI0016223486|nr:MULTISPECIES: alpha/beta hydrolase [unclassified Streptomyces]MBQ0868628.1 alpha/beta hydrolase [Streptomyces sp. RK75]MBQ1123892.1 alpha/beta hydrolase [Streptomyces sp. B15]MBQ1162260.1 alpha/beta hydrolase [Streptomyces sp. A73]
MAEHTAEQAGTTDSDRAPTDLRVRLDKEVTLRVRHRPGAADPAFLLVHGLASNARLWDEVAARLCAAGHAVYAVDLRGHGETEAPEDDTYGTAAAAADVLAAGVQLGLTRAIVGGHSWGADVALTLATEHPAFVAGLALVEGGYTDATVFYGTWERFVSMMSMAGPALEGVTLEDMRGYLRAMHPDWSDSAIEASLSSLRAGADGSLSPRLSPRRRTAILRSVWSCPPSRLYAGITQPVTLLPATPVPDNGRIAPDVLALFEQLRASLARATEGLPHATVHEYQGADHDLHAQHPDRVATHLLELAESVGRSEVM